MKRRKGDWNKMARAAQDDLPTVSLGASRK